MAEGSLTPVPAAQVPGADVRLGFATCRGFGQNFKPQNKFLIFGRKMPENCRCVKILEILPRSFLIGDMCCQMVHTLL